MLTFKSWLQDALSQEEWPNRRGYARRFDGEDFSPPMPVTLTLYGYELDGSSALLEVQAKGSGVPYALDSKIREDLERRVRALCVQELGTENLVSELVIYTAVPLSEDTINTVSEGLKIIGYKRCNDNFLEPKKGTHIYRVNARATWTREYRIYMTEGYHWTIEDPGPNAPNQEITVTFEPDSGTFLDLKCARLSPAELGALITFVDELRAL